MAPLVLISGEVDRMAVMYAATARQAHVAEGEDPRVAHEDLGGDDHDRR